MIEKFHHYIPNIALHTAVFGIDGEIDLNEKGSRVFHRGIVNGPRLLKLGGSVTDSRFCLFSSGFRLLQGDIVGSIRFRVLCAGFNTWVILRMNGRHRARERQQCNRGLSQCTCFHFRFLPAHCALKG